MQRKRPNQGDVADEAIPLKEKYGETLAAAILVRRGLDALRNEVSGLRDKLESIKLEIMRKK